MLDVGNEEDVLLCNVSVGTGVESGIGSVKLVGVDDERFTAGEELVGEGEAVIVLVSWCDGSPTTALLSEASAGVERKDGVSLFESWLLFCAVRLPQ